VLGVIKVGGQRLLFVELSTVIASVLDACEIVLQSSMPAAPPRIAIRDMAFNASRSMTSS
jgi:hypothetical protein